MKIEIYRNEKKIKVQKKKKLRMDFIDVDFSSIGQLVGNKVILEFLFVGLKHENNG